jgi:hypothetical protein
MGSTSRLFMAALALVSTAAFVRAQDNPKPEPAPAPAAAPLDEFGTPLTALSSPSTLSALSALPAIPFADGRASAVKPAFTIDRSALKIEPIVRPESTKTTTGGWIFLGLVSAGLFTSIARYRSGLPRRYPIKPIANLPLDPVPVPARLN